jgi:hypothetical protein
VLGETVYRRMTLLEIPLTPPPSVTATPPALGFRFLDTATVPAYLRLRPDFSREQVERRLEDGDRCFVVERSGELVSARWLAVGRAWVEYLGCELVLEPDEA